MSAPHLIEVLERISMVDNVQISMHRQKRSASVRLPRRVKAALEDFTRRVLTLFPDGISQIILYGSYARGKAAPDSDVDVMVVVKWSDLEHAGEYYLGGPGDPQWGQIVDAAADAMITHGPFISALVVGDTLFNSNYTIAQDARREGKLLWKNPLT
jgi:hypothetical protein